MLENKKSLAKQSGQWSFEQRDGVNLTLTSVLFIVYDLI